MHCSKVRVAYEVYPNSDENYFSKSLFHNLATKTHSHLGALRLQLLIYAKSY